MIKNEQQQTQKKGAQTDNYDNQKMLVEVEGESEKEREAERDGR